ncbi:MAG: redoxin domain-containing protein [Planctomycetia bacterium]|nr:redoxin domain-containing protein [Planctomycetia bacterium]
MRSVLNRTCLFVIAALLMPACGKAPPPANNARAPGTGSTAPAVKPGSAATEANAVDDSRQLPSKLVGSVTVAGTEEPVAGATIHVLTGRKIRIGESEILAGRTDNEGRYAVDLPAGHARSIVPEFPPGYWGESAFETFITTAEAPEFTKNYVVQRGPVWRARVVPDGDAQFVMSLRLSVSRKQEGRFIESRARPDNNGAAQLTIPGASGDFQITVYDRARHFQLPNVATLTLERGFLPDQVAEIIADAEIGGFRIKDRNGLSAIFKGARATLDGTSVTLEIDVKPRAPESLGRVTGVVVDEHGRPVAGATIAVALGDPAVGSGITTLGATSGAGGRFVIDRIPIEGAESGISCLYLAVTRNGYAAWDSEDYELPADGGAPRDVGRIRLARGFSVRLSLVGPDGQPLAGAWVKPTSGGYANWSQVAVTDAAGRCVIPDLSSGRQGFRAEYGTLFASFAAEAGSDPDEVAVPLKPMLRTQPIPQITGIVQCPDGRPVSKAIVRFGIRQLVFRQPVVADDEGRFELPNESLSEEDDPRIPLAALPLIAFDPYGPLAARINVPLDKPRDVVLQLEPHEADWPLQELASMLGDWQGRPIPPEETQRRKAQSLLGKPAPELDGALWLNTERPTMLLADFRGKYVLLDFWDVGCAPCHSEFPAIKTLYEMYKDKGLVVIGVHENTSDFNLVRRDVAKSGLNFPIVVDRRDRRIMARYEEHGIVHWPSYLLIGPDGTVLADELTGQPTLQFARMEFVRKYLAAAQ